MEITVLFPVHSKLLEGCLTCFEWTFYVRSCYSGNLEFKNIALVLKYTVTKVFIIDLVIESLGHLLMFIEDFGTWLTVFSPFQTATYILGTSMKVTHLTSLISTALWVPQKAETNTVHGTKVLYQARAMGTSGLATRKLQWLWFWPLTGLMH